MEVLSTAELDALRKWPTPAIANAIETFDVRPRNAGGMLGIRCMFPEMEPMVGYACTARMAAREQPAEPTGNVTLAHWDNISGMSSPRVAVIEDRDDPPAFGSLWGEVNANIHRALGCLGVVTSGGVRDLDEVQELGFHFFAADVIPTHAYVHLVEVGIDATVGGLQVSNGDLIHADKHGVVTIPHEIAREIPRAAQEVEDKERRIINYCKSPAFKVENLKSGTY
ncbi:MAG: RraA family protein [Acidobacteriota bacterium]|nr:RraA family protein [Acidobacteriota bacterium]